MNENSDRTLKSETKQGAAQAQRDMPAWCINAAMENISWKKQLCTAAEDNLAKIESKTRDHERNRSIRTLTFFNFPPPSPAASVIFSFATTPVPPSSFISQ